MKIEDRIRLLSENAGQVATVAEAELARRLVYVTRANVLVGVIANTLGAMNKVQGEGVPSDFNDDWRALRLRLAHSQSRLERIITGAALPIEDHERA